MHVAYIFSKTSLIEIIMSFKKGLVTNNKRISQNSYQIFKSDLVPEILKDEFILRLTFATYIDRTV